MVSSANHNACGLPNLPSKQCRSVVHIPQLRLPSLSIPSTTGHMESLRRHLETREISEGAISLIIASWRKNNDNYNSAWKKWETWCNSGDVYPLSSDISDILSFLADEFKQGKQYRLLNCYKSALSSIHLPVESFPVSQHPLVSRLLKGVFNTRL